MANHWITYEAPSKKSPTGKVAVFALSNPGLSPGLVADADEIQGQPIKQAAKTLAEIFDHVDMPAYEGADKLFCYNDEAISDGR